MYKQIYSELIEWQARNPYHEPEICMTVDLLQAIKTDTEFLYRLTAYNNGNVALFGLPVHIIEEDGMKFWIANAVNIVEDVK